MINFIICSIAYIVASTLAYLIVKNDANKKQTKTISLKTVILISAIFTVFNIIATIISTTVGGDRHNYTYNFNGIRETSSTGLSIVIGFLKTFTDDVNILFYFTTFAVMFITLLAYRKCKYFEPTNLLFLFFTQYILFTLVGIKQSYANAFGALSIMTIIDNKKAISIIKSILYAFVAILFHPSAYILVLIIPILLIKKTKIRMILITSVMILSLFGLKGILLKTGEITKTSAPVISLKINTYIGEESKAELSTAGSESVIKGAPYYAVTVYALIKRKKRLSKDEEYDNYLFISILLSCVYIASLYNSWIYRLSYMLYVPTTVLFSKAISKVDSKETRLIKCVVYGTMALMLIRYIFQVYVRYGGF